MMANPRAVVAYALLISAAFLVSPWFLLVGAFVLLLDVLTD